MKGFLHKMWFAVKHFFENIGEYIVRGSEYAFNNMLFLVGISGSTMVASFIMFMFVVDVLDALVLAFLLGYSVWVIGLLGYWVAGTVIEIAKDLGAYDIREDLANSYAQAGIVYEARRTAGGRYE